MAGDWTADPLTPELSQSAEIYGWLMLDADAEIHAVSPDRRFMLL